MKTKTIKASETSQPSLTRAVIRQLGGSDSLSDIASHGASGGYAGFTYYTDTVSFAKRNKALILERLKNDAESFGNEGVISLLASFQCFKGMTQEEIADGLYNPKSDNRQTVFNGLAWYAAEEIAREMNPEI